MVKLGKESNTIFLFRIRHIQINRRREVEDANFTTYLKALPNKRNHNIHPRHVNIDSLDPNYNCRVYERIFKEELIIAIT